MKINNLLNTVNRIDNGNLVLKPIGYMKCILLSILYVMLSILFSIPLSYITKFENGLLKNVFTITISFLFYLLIVFIINRFFLVKASKDSLEYKPLKTSTYFICFGISVGMFMVILMVTKCLFIFYDYLEFSNKMNLAMDNHLYLITFACIVGPICEELIMRGIVMNNIARTSSNINAVIISSIMFGFMHLNIVQGVVAFLLGIILSVIYIQTKSLIIPVFLHVSYNFLSFLALVSTDNNYYSIIHELQLHFTLAIGIIGLLVSIYLFKYKLINRLNTSSRNDEYQIEQ